MKLENSDNFSIVCENYEDSKNKNCILGRKIWTEKEDELLMK